MTTASVQKFGTKAWIVVAADGTILSHHLTRNAAREALR